jgi:hypothetical protein
MIDNINDKIHNELYKNYTKEEVITKEVETFMKNKETEPKFDNIIEDDTTENANEDEIISVCLENDYDFETDDDDDDEIFNKLVQKNMIITSNDKKENDSLVDNSENDEKQFY